MKKFNYLVILGLAAVLSGCAGEGGTVTGVGVIGTGQKGRAAKLMLSHRAKFSAATYAELKSKDGASLLAAGFTFDDAAKTITHAPEPIRGRIVKIGSYVTGTDSDGVLKIPDIGTLPAKGTVLNTLSSTTGWDFPTASLGTLDTPSSVPISIETDGELLVTRMDNAVTSRPSASTLLTVAQQSEIAEGCKNKPGKIPADAVKDQIMPLASTGRCTGTCGTNCGPANTCCEIADGYIPYATKPCDRINAVIAFQGSTCFRWWMRSVCAPPGTGVAGDEGICYQTHKGRWCQEIKEGAAEKVTTTCSQASPIKIVNGDTLEFQVNNDTRRNTVLVWYINASPNVGTLSSDHTEGPASGQMIEIKFWDDEPDICQFLWHSDRTFRFTANLPQGVDRANITIQVSGYPGIENFDVEICR